MTIPNRLLLDKYLRHNKKFPHIWCPGCGNGIVLSALLRAIDRTGSGVIQDHPVVLSSVRGIPFGVDGDSLLTIVRGDEGSADLYRVDLTSGDATLLASSESYLVAGLAASGAIAVSGFGDVTVEPGAPVLVLTPPPDVTYYDLDW